MSNVTLEVDGFPILNPFTPLGFLSPNIALQVQISRYILVGTLGAFIWDILNNIGDDYILLTHYRMRLPTIVYFVSKLSSLAYVLASTIFETAPISTCTSTEKYIQVIFSVAIPSTSLLFFLRVRAIFGMNPWVVGFFGCLWLAVLAGCLATVPAVSAMTIGPTEYCADGYVKSYAEMAAIIPLVNDTLIFLATSWRMWRNSYALPTVRDGARVFLFGDFLPIFSKSMLQDGQAYYLTIATVNISAFILLCVNPIPATYRGVFTIPNILLMNVMACRVYRKTIFGHFFRENGGSDIISRDVRTITRSVIPLSLMGERSAQESIITPSPTRGTNIDNAHVMAGTQMVEQTAEDLWSLGEKDKRLTRGFGTV